MSQQRFPSRDEVASRAFGLDSTVIDAIAVRLSDAVVARVIEVIRSEGLIPQPRAARAWLDAQQVAEQLGVSREWVYEHAKELGATRIGRGPRPRLRFPAQGLDASGNSSGRRPKRIAPSRIERRTEGLIPISEE